MHLQKKNTTCLIKDQEAYTALWPGVTNPNFYASPAYLDLVSEVLGLDWECLGLCNCHGEMTAALPFFCHEHPRFGSVINSLPFFGSYGGVQAVFPGEETIHALFSGLKRIALERACSAWTIIADPFGPDILYEQILNPTYMDLRISQTNLLPGTETEVEAALLSSAHPTRQRNIKKALKLGVTTRELVDTADIEGLEAMHLANMAAIGGIPKPPAFFQALPHHFSLGDQVRLFAAFFGERVVAYLLCFVCNATAEYYMPAYDLEHKDMQALSLLILKAMTTFAKEGVSTWNWGGTWLTQDGVYTYKKKWGAGERPYKYYTVCNKAVFDLTTLDRETISHAYPYFYVIPFSRLHQGN